MNFILYVNGLIINLLLSRYIAVVEIFIHKEKINLNKRGICRSVTILKKHLINFILNLNVLSITLLFSRFICVLETFIHKA